MSTNIVDFPDPDETFELDTHIPIVDMAAEVIARRLKDRSWEARTRFFNNVIVSSVEAAGKMIKLAAPNRPTRKFTQTKVCMPQRWRAHMRRLR